MLLDKFIQFHDFFTKEYKAINDQLIDLEANYKKVINHISSFNKSIKDISLKSLNRSNIPEAIPFKDDHFIPFIESLSDQHENLSSSLEYTKDNMEVFTIILFGKVNSGKSYLGNLLSGYNLKLGLNQRYEFKAIGKDNKEITIPYFAVKAIECTKTIEWCKIGSLKIVDLPGLDSIDQYYHQLSTDFMRHADLVIHLTNSDAPLRASDFEHILNLDKQNKSVIVCITQCDRKEDFKSKQRIPLPDDIIKEQMDYVKEQIEKSPHPLNVKKIIPISSLLAKEGLDKYRKGDQEKGFYQMENSRIEELLSTIMEVVKQEGSTLRLATFVQNYNTNLDQLINHCQSFKNQVDQYHKTLLDYEESLEKLLSRVSDEVQFDYYYLSYYLADRKRHIDAFADSIFSLLKLGETFINNLLIGKSGTLKKVRHQFEKEVLSYKELRDLFDDVINERTIPRIEQALELLFEKYHFRGSIRSLNISQDYIDSVVSQSIKESMDIIFGFISRTVQKFIIQSLGKRLAGSRLGAFIPYLGPALATSEAISLKVSMDKGKAELKKYLLQTFEDIEQQIAKEYKNITHKLIQDMKDQVYKKNIQTDKELTEQWYSLLDQFNNDLKVYQNEFNSQTSTFAKDGL